MNSKTATSKEKRNTVLITIAVIAVAVLIIGLVVYNAVADSGYFVRSTVGAETEHFTVNGSMMITSINPSQSDALGAI